jgi:photosystem II stability/assembly factor-like uncharacterized protein
LPPKAVFLFTFEYFIYFLIRPGEFMLQGFQLQRISILLLMIILLPIDRIEPQHQSLWDQVPSQLKDRNSFKRFEWFYRQRTFPYDTISIHTYYSEREKEIEKYNSGNPSLDNNLLWNPVGPAGIISGFPSHWGEMSGRVRGIAVHPTNHDIVYIGAAAGGIWKTTNGGSSWTNIGENLASLTFGSIAIDPGNPNIIYAGSGEIMYSFNPYIYEGKGLYKSTDAGQTWTQITAGFGLQTHFGNLVVSPHNSNYVFAALGSGSWFTGNLGNEGIWRSTNAGINWTRVLNVADAFDVVVHPNNPNLVYAAIGGGLSTSGYYYSTNGGSTFIQSNTGLPAANQIQRMQISVHYSGVTTTVYAVIYNSTNGTRAYKSVDGGGSWGQISTGTQLGGTYNGTNWADQGWYDLCIAVNPTNVNQVFIGNVEIHRTTNGSTFSPVRISGGTGAWDSPMHVDYHKIVFAPSNSNTIYVGCDGGIYKSTNGGTNWFSANSGLATIQLYRIASHPSNKNIIFGGAQDNGNFRTTDGGATPYSFVSTGDGMECFYDYSNPNTVYFSTQNGWLAKSTNGGASYNFLTSVNGNWITPFFQHPQNNQWLYTANQSILRSTNGGSSFTTIASNVAQSDYINTMSMTPLGPFMVFAASGTYTGTPQVKISTDAGFTWTDITANIPGQQRYISRVLWSPVISNQIFIVRSGFSPGNKVYRSTDMGVTWTNISGNLPDVPHNDIFIDPMQANHYYVANDLGVYRTTDGGTNWTREGLGLPFVPVMDLDYVHIGTNRWLRAATHGRSAFETDLDVIVPVELVSFSANAVNGNIELKWITASEKNNRGFEIERSINEKEFETIAFVNGSGTTTENQEYIYFDYNVSGLLRYRLRQIDFDGSFSYSDIVELNLITNFVLHQNYPNPFNPITKISYTLPYNANVRLSVYNALGEEIEVLLELNQESGYHEAIWNAVNVTSGIYFYKIEASPVNGEKGFKGSRKMILLR